MLGFSPPKKIVIYVNLPLLLTGIRKHTPSGSHFCKYNCEEKNASPPQGDNGLERDRSNDFENMGEIFFNSA